MMSGNKWVRSMGLDTDGTLFVEMENGITLYDTCLKTSTITPIMDISS